MSEPIVHVVEDDAAARQGMVEMLQARGHRVQAYESSEAFLAEADRGGLGCIVTDMRLPGLSGLELQQRLAAEGCDLPVIVVTAFGDVPTAVSAMRDGAVTFIEKPCQPNQLNQFITESIERHAQQRREGVDRQSAEQSYAKLSDSEKAVLQRILEGQPNKGIAHELNLGLRTVELRRAKIMEKFAADGLPDLVQKAMKVEALRHATPSEGK